MDWKAIDKERKTAIYFINEVENDKYLELFF